MSIEQNYAVVHVEGLNPFTEDLVSRFSLALAEKLKSAQDKYNIQDAWMNPGWEEQCRQHLLEHLNKGDPRDVAAYCAFAWHHGWPTSTKPST